MNKNLARDSFLAPMRMAAIGVRAAAWSERRILLSNCVYADGPIDEPNHPKRDDENGAARFDDAQHI